MIRNQPVRAGVLQRTIGAAWAHASLELCRQAALELGSNLVTSTVLPIFD